MDSYQLARPAHRRPWTEEEDRVMLDMIGAGEMIAPIADMLGRTREAVRNRANLLGRSVQTTPGRGRRRIEPRIAG